MNRREFLSAWSAVGVGIASGCIGTGDEATSSERSTKKTVEEIKAEGIALELRDTHVEQETVKYADEFTISATIANVGSEPVRAHSLARAPEFEVNYVESDRSFDRNSQSDAGDIQPESGDVITITLGPFDAAITGSWGVEAGRYIEFVEEGAEATFEIQPQRPSIGQSVPLLRGASMTVDDFHLFETMFAEYNPRERSNTSPAVRLETPPDGQLFAVAEVTVTNEGLDYLTVSDTPRQFQLGPFHFSLRPTESYEFADGVDPNHARLPGKRFESISLSEGESQTAWLLGTIDIDRRDELQLAYDKRTNAGPPEAIFDNETVSYPSFEFVRGIASNDWGDGSERVGAVVKNVGDSAGTFKGIVQYEGPETGTFLNPLRGNELERTIAAGETAEVTVQYDRRKGDRYRIQPFDVTIGG